MTGQTSHLVRITFDDSEMNKQSEQLESELLRLFGAGWRDNIPSDFSGKILSLRPDVVLGDGGTAEGTGGVRHWFARVRYGRCFDDIMSALRAYEINHGDSILSI